MLSLDNTCPKCGKAGCEALERSGIDRVEASIVCYCNYCFFRSPEVRLCSRVSQSLLSASVLTDKDAPIELLRVMLTCASVIPTSGSVADYVVRRFYSILSYEDDGDTLSHLPISVTPFGRLVWFAGMYGHRFITLTLLQQLFERSVGPTCNGTHISGESL